jgi:hypothetical protein
VFSAAPVIHSSAIVETPFWEGMDLAIGLVRGPVEQRCVRELSEFDTSVQPEAGARAHLLRLRQSGEPERVEMLITDSQYLTLDAETADGKTELFKGNSGAFLFSGDRPIGMVIETPSPTKGHFIRIEEIFRNLERRLDRRAGFAAADQPDVPAAETSEGALLFRFVDATLAPVDPDQSEANLTAPGSYVFKLTRPNRIAFKVDGPKAVAVSRVTILSSADAPAGLPRDIVIEVSSNEDGSRVRPFGAGAMMADGRLDIRRQATKALWVFVTVHSGWDSPVIGVDSIVIR